MKTMIRLAGLALALVPMALPLGVRAAELYLGGKLGFSSTEVDGGGSTQFFTISGSDDDSSPAWGGTVGFSFAINEIAPRIRLPQLDEIALPAWKVRLELEGLTGRDWEIRTDGGDGFFSEVESSSAMVNLWLEFPIYEAIRWAFGRMPMFEPVSLYVGGGLGHATLEVETTDNFSEGDEDESGLATQFGLGLAYALTPATTVTFGYRAIDFGDVDVPLSFQPGTTTGTHEFEFETREFITSLRYDFYAAPLEEMHPRHWRVPRFSLPRPSLNWLPWRRRRD